MISFAVEGWAGATLAIDTFDTLATWSFDARIGGDVASVYEVLADVAAWCAGNAFESLPYPQTWVQVRPGADGRLRMRLETDAESGWDGYDYNASANFAARAGWLSGHQVAVQPYYTVPDIDVDSATGTVASLTWALENWTRWGRRTGVHTSRGGWNGGIASVELRRPALRACLNEAQALACAAAQEAASVPRRAHAYDPSHRVWREVAVGAVRIEEEGDVGAVLYTASLEVLG